MPHIFAKTTATSAEESANIVPRAEFRVFGRGVIDVVKPRMWNGETVLFKAREMPEGYEIFQPRGKFQFPVGRSDLAAILSQLKVDLPLDADEYTIENFIDMVRRPTVFGSFESILRSYA